MAGGPHPCPAAVSLEQRRLAPASRPMHKLLSSLSGSRALLRPRCDKGCVFACRAGRSASGPRAGSHRIWGGSSRGDRRVPAGLREECVSARRIPAPRGWALSTVPSEGLAGATPWQPTPILLRGAERRGGRAPRAPCASAFTAARGGLCPGGWPGWLCARGLREGRDSTEPAESACSRVHQRGLLGSGQSLRIPFAVDRDLNAHAGIVKS